MNIKRVGIVGCGLMGRGIVEVTAKAGYEVIVSEINQELLDKGMAAVEHGEYGIRVNCIAPGWHLNTNLGKSAGRKIMNEDEWGRMIASKTPMKRTGEPGEMKGLLLYLASDASSFVTGQVIIEDGGWTSW